MLFRSYSLTWLPEAVRNLSHCGVDVTHTYIQSKCGMGRLAHMTAGGVSGTVSISTAGENVGREAHTYLSHIVRSYEMASPPALVFFLTDSYHAHAAVPKQKRRVPLCTMAAAAAHGVARFGCGQLPATLSHGRGTSAWHLTDLLQAFGANEHAELAEPWDQTARLWAKGSSAPQHPTGRDRGTTRAPFATPEHPTLGSWVKRLLPNLTLPPVVPVCYGGSFVASGGAVRHVGLASWQQLLAQTSRGDRIIEAHYMERLWGILLSRLPTAREAARLICAASLKNERNETLLPGSATYANLHMTSYVGALFRCVCTCTAEPQ